MHERGPVSEAAVAFITAAPPGVTEVELAVAADVDRGTAKDVWAHVVEGTSVEHVSLRITVHVPEMMCLTCSAHFTGDKLDQCPTCGGDGLPIEKVPTAAIVGWTTDTGL